ncbi:catechol 2,3-dioxygenase [Dechloromonas denitrificans]|uniref:catechol 2,3-dioxygenase n=1 Tax=Dechloromonas denitrificans TaxID=281362 RepID=UPI001CF8BFB2|nr:catechol 2,3-dioxygenase [Dechloromonas denitrificans]UCV01677.1 catechol 2,3-dioxygenase [Dechloromonas denitrificans]
MATTGVMRPGHVQVRVLDMDESIHFYGNVLGLVETGRDAAGRVYFKAWDEHDHHSVILRQAESAGMDFIGFKVRDRATLEKLDADLQAYGVKTERMAAGDLLETGERVRFVIPTGHTVELYAEKTCVGNSQSDTNPDPWTAEAEHGMAPIRFDHALLYGPDIDGNLKLFTEVLGFYLVERVLLEDGESLLAIFISCGHKAHDLAFVRHPEPNKLHHISFLLQSWEKVLRAADLMSMNRVPIDIGPTRHGITRGATIYAFDPSGNRFETFAQGYETYPDYPTKTWTFAEVGTGIFYHDRQLNERFLSVVT